MPPRETIGETSSASKKGHGHARKRAAGGQIVELYLLSLGSVMNRGFSLKRAAVEKDKSCKRSDGRPAARLPVPCTQTRFIRFGSSLPSRRRADQDVAGSHSRCCK